MYSNLPNWVELPNYCMNVFTEWWAFSWCHYNQFNEAIDTPVKWNQTMWVTFCQSCIDFSCSKYVQFAHITISDEMQSITIRNIFVLWPKPLSKGWCSFANLDIWKPRKMQKLGNSTQKHMGYMQCPHHSYWESVDKHGLHIMDNKLIAEEIIAGS